jgi:hypothetical protein
MDNTFKCFILYELEFYKEKYNIIIRLKHNETEVDKV